MRSCRGVTSHLRGLAWTYKPVQQATVTNFWSPQSEHRVFPHDMDTSSVPLLDYGLQYQWCSDSDLSSISSPETLSPVHSMDSSLSPSDQRPPQSTAKAPKTGYSQNLKSSPYSLSRRGRKSGQATRIRSKQRESASEKEKLRMRDLTKALHHLRSYLPPSVAPAGQTLTKIETLRLAIRYISYLSAQLGLSEEALFQRKEQLDTSASDTSSPDILSYFQRGSLGGGQEAPLQSQSLYAAQCQSQNVMLHSGNCSFGGDPYSREHSRAPQGEVGMDAFLQSPATTQPSCQVQYASVYESYSYSSASNKMLITALVCFNADVWQRLLPPTGSNGVLGLNAPTLRHHHPTTDKLHCLYCLTVNLVIYLKSIRYSTSYLLHPCKYEYV